MTNQDKLICATYALISIAALPATWINNLAFMQQPNNTFSDFFVAAYANAAAASLANDLFLLAIAASIFMVIEGQRVGVRYVWLYLLLSGILAISVTFPLFLLARHIKVVDKRTEQSLVDL